VQLALHLQPSITLQYQTVMYHHEADLLLPAAFYLNCCLLLCMQQVEQEIGVVGCLQGDRLRPQELGSVSKLGDFDA